MVLALLVILLKLKPKYCFKKILFKARLHFFVSFSFETQFEVHLNDPELVFEVKETYCSNHGNPAMVHSRSDSEKLDSLLDEDYQL